MAATIKRLQHRAALTRTWQILSTNEYPEFIIVMGKTMWGFWALLPWWSMFDSTTSFVWLADQSPISPDVFWGSIFFCTGVVHGVALYRKWYWWRWALTVLSLALWLWVCGSIGFSNFRSSAMVIYPLFATSAFVAHIVLKR